MMGPVFARRLRLFLLLPLWLGLCACGRDAEEKRTMAELGTGEIRWQSFPVDLQVDAAILNDSDAHRDLTEAITYWEDAANRPLFNLVGSWPSGQSPYRGLAEDPDFLLANVLYLHDPWPFDPNFAGKTIVHSENGAILNSVILLKGDSHFCPGHCLGNGSTVSRQKLIAHELGHFLGFGHSDSPTDLMYPRILSLQPLESLEVDHLMLERLTK